MNKAELYALDQAQSKLYPSVRHEGIAKSIALGDLPPEHSWSVLQTAAVVAHLDGQDDPHSYWITKRVDLGHGHVEAVACKVTVDPWKDACRRHFGQRAERGEAGDDVDTARNAARAKTKVRQLCKMLGANSLGTLTYRDNVTDRALVLKHWKAWVRRVRVVLPHFDYVAVLEPQERGSLHVHIAMRKLPSKVLYGEPGRPRQLVKSWDVMRAIWRRVIGGSGGNFDESSKLGRGRFARVMKIAAYIGKYVAKDFAHGLLNSKRYFASERPQPVVERVRYAESSLGELVALLYASIPGDQVDVATWVQPKRGFFWLSSYTGAPS